MDFQHEESWEDDDPDDDSPEYLPCPNCREEVYEESEQCPYCGEYITHSTSPWVGRPVWWVVVGLLGIAMTVLAMMR